MSEDIIHVTQSNFDNEVVNSGVPVLVDFWAEWCPPCKMISPLLDELARDYRGKVSVAKVDIDDSAEIATQLGVMNIPTIIFFKDGKEYKRIVGANPKAVFEKVIKELL